MRTRWMNDGAKRTCPLKLFVYPKSCVLSIKPIAEMIRPLYSSCLTLQDADESWEVQSEIYDHSVLIMPSSDHLRSKSSSRNGAEPQPVAPARPKRLLKQNSTSSSETPPLFRSRSSRQQRQVSHQDFPSPGEIFTEDGQMLPETESVSGAKRDGQRYRELSGTDLVVVIDLQQSLLDRLNAENRELAAKSREMQVALARVNDENEKLRSAVELRTVSSNVDVLLDRLEETDDAEGPKKPAPISVISVEQTLAAQIGALQAEIASHKEENKRLLNELDFLRSQLDERTKEVDNLNEHLSKRQPEPRSTLDLRFLVETLSENLKRYKLREENELEVLAGAREALARSTVENSALKENLHRLETEITSARSDHDTELQSKELSFRAEKDSITAELGRKLEHELLRQKDLAESLQTVNVKLAEERLRREQAETQVSFFAKQTASVEQLVSENVRHLQVELAQLKLTAGSAEERYIHQRQNDELERQHYVQRFKDSEDRLSRVRDQLRHAETGWSVVGQENTQLLEKLADADRRIARTNQASQVSSDAAEQSDAVRNEKELEILRKQKAVGDGEMQELLHSQSDLIEKFREECQWLAGKLDEARMAYREELGEMHTVNADVGDKYANAVDLNQRLLSECHRLGQLVFSENPSVAISGNPRAVVSSL